jgi:hypothetical protein
LIHDDSGTWTGNSNGKTFEYKHTHFILSSERWSSSGVENKGINVLKSNFTTGEVISASVDDFPSICQFQTVLDSDGNPITNFFTQTILFPYTSRIRGDDCFYIRSSLFGGESIQTNHGGGGSDLLKMIQNDKSPGEVLFYRPAYTPEPHIITRREIPSISFRITDKDHRLVEFNGENVLLEIEFLIYDIVSLPIIHPENHSERFSAPSSFAPDYARRAFNTPLGNSHIPNGFQNYR